MWCGHHHLCNILDIQRDFIQSSRTDVCVCACLRVTLTERRHFHAVLDKVQHILPHDIFHYAVDITGRAIQNVCHLFVLRLRTKLAFIFEDHNCGTH